MTTRLIPRVAAVVVIAALLAACSVLFRVKISDAEAKKVEQPLLDAFPTMIAVSGYSYNDSESLGDDYVKVIVQFPPSERHLEDQHAADVRAFVSDFYDGAYAVKVSVVYWDLDGD